MKCCNEKCNKNLIDSINPIVVTIDGDMVCDEKCKIEFEKQRDDFFNNIADDNWYNEYMGIE